MKNTLFLTFFAIATCSLATCSLNAQKESIQEKKAQIAQERKDKAYKKAQEKAARKKRDEIKRKERKARLAQAAQEINSVAETSKKLDDYVPGRFMSKTEKELAVNKTDAITQINDSFTF